MNDLAEVDHPAELVREQMLGFLAIAAVRWINHQKCPTNAESARHLLEALNRAAAQASWFRSLCGVPQALMPAQLVEAFSCPLADWLPKTPNIALIEAGELTPWCEDVAESMGNDPHAEVEQQIILSAIDNLTTRADGAAVYTQFRRFLIEHPVTTEEAARRIAVEVGVPLYRLYEPIGSECQLDTAQGQSFYSCPCCGWPMQVSNRTERLACRAERCQRNGSRFHIRSGTVVPMGRCSVPAPKPVSGLVRLRRGVWRYTLQPGLTELDLAKRLKKLPEVQVALWPELDRYDLDVKYGAQRWRVDVKDHHSARVLAEHLRIRKPRELIYVVVPNERKDQPQLLRRLCSESNGYRFHTISSFLRLVRKALLS